MTRRTPRGTGSVYQRANNGLWVAATYHNGKKYTFTAELQHEAIAKRETWLKERADGLQLDASQWTLRDWLDAWLERKKPVYDRHGNRLQGIQTLTWEKYESVIRLHICSKRGLGDVRLTLLTSDMVEAWQRRLIKDDVGADPRREALLVLSQALKLAVLRRLVPYNVADAQQVERPRAVRRDHVQPAEDDLASLLRAIQDDPLEALVWIGLGAGLRRGEVAGLQWTDVTYTPQGMGLLRAHRRVNRVTAARRSCSTSTVRDSNAKSSSPERTPHPPRRLAGRGPAAALEAPAGTATGKGTGVARR